MEPRPPSERVVFIAKLGAWLQVALVLGIVAIIVEMAKASEVLNTNSASDPARFNEAIGDVLNYALIAVRVTLPGLVLVTLAITACGYRSRWMFQFLCFYGLLVIGLNICLVILGHFMLSFYLPFGLFFLIFAQVKKGEFMQAAGVKRKLPSCYNLDA